MSSQLLTLREASTIASQLTNRNIFVSNISYLLQYGKLNKMVQNGNTLIKENELRKYYEKQIKIKKNWEEQLGNDLNWTLSFEQLQERETTKHVHRLHPYKGKFIPQLVEYFLDNHTDKYKISSFFNTGDIILDPFMGSGTTLVQANELGLHSIGIDISKFNCIIAKSKLSSCNIEVLQNYTEDIKQMLASYNKNKQINSFEEELSNCLSEFNKINFPSPVFKYEVYQKIKNETEYSVNKEKEFKIIFYQLVKKYDILLTQQMQDTFLDKWYTQNIREETNFVLNHLNKIKNKEIQEIFFLILTRTIRSCRATTHFDLATLKKPQFEVYYCWKHKKICKPIFSIQYWLNRYMNDTINRLQEFQQLKTNSYHSILSHDSRDINITEKVKQTNLGLYKILKDKKITGIFTSPPYLGQIDYHEQHAYAYELLSLDRKDALEIGPLFKGQGKEAKLSYIDGISKVLINCQKYLSDDCNIFIVANDKYNLYPTIAEKSHLKIVQTFKRPVLNRTERDKNPYSEFIFHMRRE